jgi:hypothetical protein
VVKYRKEKRRMKTKIFAIVFIAVLLLGALGAIYVPTAKSSVPPQPVGDNEPYAIDGTPQLEGMTVSWAQPDTGNTWTVIVYNYYLGGFYYLNFDCIVQGATCNVWVGLSPKVWTGGYKDERVENGPGIEDDVFYFAYPWSYNAHIVSYRYLDGYRDYVTVPQLKAVANEFDSKIGQKCVNFFGDYDHSRTGPLGDGKIQILVFNIRDEFFYGIFNVGFIMGYFWSYVSNLNNANIIHIDTWQWYRRQGPTPDGGVGCPYIAVPYTGSSLLPYQYEGTVAHEFQHLIHYDNDPDEYSWVNEGCSTLAEFICGYGHTTNLQYYMIYFWDTSLVIWEGNLQNYGVVYLWTLYMYEHYGGQPLIWDIVHEQANGIQGWNNVLQAHHIKKNFDQIFEDWAIANYLDDTSFANGIYGYYNLDLPCAASGWWDIPYSIYYWGTYDEAYPTGWILPERLPYIAWYWELYNGAPELKVYFDGADYAGIFPHSPANEWYSDGTAWSWFRLGQTFAIPSAGATLKFWSNYDIEPDWDYGYVEVHDLTTGEWYTLAGTQTISTIPNPQDNPNCPANVEPTAYLAAGRWNAFTGNSGGWYQEQMDLTPFAGHNVEVYFTYWTDGYTNLLGWYIDDIEIPEIGFSDNVESGANGWTVNAGWFITNGVIENDFRVNVIETTTLIKKSETRTMYHISPMKLDDATETGKENIKVVNTKTVQTGPAVLVMASQPGYEHTWATEFLFLVDDPPFSLIHSWTH